MSTSAARPSSPSAPTSTRPVSRVLPIAAVVAAAVNVVILLVAGALGASMQVDNAGTTQTVTVLMVVIATLVPFAVGTLILLLVARRRPRARTVLAWVGLVLAVVSVIAPLTSAEDSATGAALAIMHVSTGVAWFLAVTRSR